MPPGIPVAAVGLDRGDNAALLAAEILALNNDGIRKRLLVYRKHRAEKVRTDNENVSRGVE
jgi:5-(carboxyamino)imidazole ribonucleotide mutase